MLTTLVPRVLCFVCLKILVNITPIYFQALKSQCYRI